MQHDEVIWQVIRHNHCSFMAKIETGGFCRHRYNVTGTCNRSSCPLANSRYATVMEHDGVFYLYMKTIERAHMPNKLWERVKLPINYTKALELIDKQLIYWPKLLVLRTKQKLTKLTTMRILGKKLALKTREKIMTQPTKEKKREARREEKAEKAAGLETSLEKELVKRLKIGVYGDIGDYLQILEKEMGTETLGEDKEEAEIEYVEVYEELEEEEDMEDFGVIVSRVDDVEMNDDEGSDDGKEGVLVDWKRGRKASGRKLVDWKRGMEASGRGEPAAKSKKVKVHVEVEHEDATERHVH